MDLPYIDSSKYNILDVIRLKTSNTWDKIRNYGCVGTLGKLFINDVYFCDTLEPYDIGFDQDTDICDIKHTKSLALNSSYYPLRFLAIPTGVYDVDLHVQRSKIKKYIPKEYNNCCPLIRGIRGYSGVFIHVGNLPRDTQGCLLVGHHDDSFSQFRVIDSTRIFHNLLKYL